jgi:hypothetical protein
MKRALGELLRKLELIEEDHSGLGDTNVREHMMAHIQGAFLQPEADFVPTGKYGLSPAANRRVKAALTAFCKAATTATAREGLVTFAQRLAAFQNAAVTGPNGATVADFFGVLDSSVTAPREPTSLAGLRGLCFDWTGTLDELAVSLNAKGPWHWFVLRQYRTTFLECHPGDWLWGRVRAEKRSAHRFVAVLEAEPETKQVGVGELLTTFRRMLAGIGASNITETARAKW